jgi:FixJ family two-component response regulator
VDKKARSLIADDYAVVREVIETHRASIMRKLGASSVAILIRYALRNGIIEP